MIFEFISSRVEEGGTGIIFRVRRVTNNSENRHGIETMQSYVFVPDGQDINEVTYIYLKDAGWIVE